MVITGPAAPDSAIDHVIDMIGPASGQLLARYLMSLWA